MGQFLIMTYPLSHSHAGVTGWRPSTEIGSWAVEAVQSWTLGLLGGLSHGPILDYDIFFIAQPRGCRCGVPAPKLAINVGGGSAGLDFSAARGLISYVCFKLQALGAFPGV